MISPPCLWVEIINRRVAVHPPMPTRIHILHWIIHHIRISIPRGGIPRTGHGRVRLVEIPLVMHGGSGLSDDQFRQAIQNGISKVNVSTNLVQAAESGMRTAAAQAESDFFAIMDAAQKGYRENCGRILDLFGTSGKATNS
jgi:hypothetical protein